MPASFLCCGESFVRMCSWLLVVVRVLRRKRGFLIQKRKGKEGSEVYWHLGSHNLCLASGSIEVGILWLLLFVVVDFGGVGEWKSIGSCVLYV